MPNSIVLSVDKTSNSGKLFSVSPNNTVDGECS